MSGKTVNTYDMKFLRIDEDTSIADDDEILERMRDWFEAWHRGEAKYRTFFLYKIFIKVTVILSGCIPPSRKKTTI